MNIMINNYCNLNCKYCFANEVMEFDKQNMSANDFITTLDFLEHSGIRHLSIIGGEPTLHPAFIEFLEIIKLRQKNDSVLIFSNGLFNKTVSEGLLSTSKVKRISFLINYNHPSILGEARNELLLNNIKRLHSNNIDITLGINFYKPNQDYQYIIEKSKEFNLKSVRWALVVPNNINRNNFNITSYFKENKEQLIRFFESCSQSNIKPNVDCNNIPLCLFDDDEFRKIVHLGLNSISACYPVIDILPDLTVIRCFALSGFKNAKLTDFKTKSEINEYFTKTIDDQYSSVPLFNECRNCVSFKMKNKSCACIAYKVKAIN